VNFDAEVAIVVREGLLLAALGYSRQLQEHTVELDGSSVVASISFLISELAPLVPIADSLSESLKRFSGCSLSSDPMRRMLLVEARSEVVKVIKEGARVCWSIHPRTIRDEIKPFACKLSQCINRFKKLSDCAKSLCEQFHAVISAIALSAKASSAQPLNISVTLSSLDKIVQEVELGGFANAQSWVEDADTALEAALVSHLSALLQAWTTFVSAERDTPAAITAESIGISQDFFCIVSSALKAAPVHYLNMTVKSSSEILTCHPPVAESLQYMVVALNSIISSVASQQRLLARTIKKSVSKKPATYSSLVSLIPGHVLGGAYAAIFAASTRAQCFVDHWQSLQTLWTSSPTEAAAFIGTDLEKWRSVLSDIRLDRAQKNSSDTTKCIGPFQFDFSAAQSKVIQRYDLWLRALLDLFSQHISQSKADLLKRMMSARELLESLSTTLGTDATLKLLVSINEHEGSYAAWQSQIDILAQGEALASARDDHRARMEQSITLDRLRGALSSFEQIFSKRKAAVTAAKSVLQQHVLDEERASVKYYEELLKDWDASKPDSKNCDALNALEILVCFTERCDVLSARVSRVSAALKCLAAHSASSSLPIQVQQLQAEISRMQLVWVSLSGPYRSLAELDALQLAAAAVPSIKALLDSAKSQAKALPSEFFQFSAFRGLIERIDSRTRTLPFISDLKSPAMQPRHWQMLARSCNVSLPMDGISLGLLWNSSVFHNEASLKDVISVAQGEFALQEFLDEIKTHWSSLKFEMYAVGRRALNIKGWELLFLTLSEQRANIASMKSSPYFAAFQEQAGVWEDRLFRISQFMDVVVETQRKWIYLEGIFGVSGEIQSQIPLECNRFRSCDAEFISAMYKISQFSSIFDAVQDADLKRSFDRSLESLSKIQKSLAEYLETKRSEFPRFYFVGDEDLLELLGNSNDITRLQLFFRKMFPGIAFVELNDKLAVTASISPDGEVMPLETSVAAPAGRSVSVWLEELRTEITRTLRVKECLAAYHSLMAIYSTDLSCSNASDHVSKWMDGRVCQALITSMQVAWTASTSKNLETTPTATVQRTLDQVSEMLSIVCQMSFRPDLDNISRKKREHCILELVHQVILVEIVEETMYCQFYFARNSFSLQRDVLRELSSSESQLTPQSFAWLKHARFYVDAGDDMVVCMADGRFPYGWENLGAAQRLVHTKLTDRCRSMSKRARAFH
jgi:dynein heavy chain 1